MSAFTVAPGRSRIRSTRAAVRAVIQRMSSGTSAPSPCTERSISPRCTVSTHTLARSTVGAAASSRPSGSVTARIVTPPPTARRRRRRLRLGGVRGMSIAVP